MMTKSKLVMAGAMMGLCSCATVPYVWVDNLPPAAMVPDAYRIQPYDSISVLIWNQTKLSVDVKVRPDGQVTLPLLGDVAVAGLTPTGASQQIEHRLDGLVVDPKVTVTLKETQAATFSVVGEVKSSGTYPLQPAEGILQALATAGGLSEYAKSDGIYVIRRGPDLKRIRFDYDLLAHASGRGILFQLRDGDILVVE